MPSAGGDIGQKNWGCGIRSEFNRVVKLHFTETVTLDKTLKKVRINMSLLWRRASPEEGIDITSVR